MNFYYRMHHLLLEHVTVRVDLKITYEGDVMDCLTATNPLGESDHYVGS